jgi:hypothetical protein
MMKHYTSEHERVHVSCTRGATHPPLTRLRRFMRHVGAAVALALGRGLAGPSGGQVQQGFPRRCQSAAEH